MTYYWVSVNFPAPLNQLGGTVIPPRLARSDAVFLNPWARVPIGGSNSESVNDSAVH